MIRKFYSFIFAILVMCSAARAQSDLTRLNETPYAPFAAMEDLQGKRVEGYLLLYPREITVTSRDKQEKTIPFEAVESIKLEKVNPGIPGVDLLPGGEKYYSVHLKNSKEVFTLKNRYSLSLNTELGVVVREIDPEMVQSSPRKTPSSLSGSSLPNTLIRDKSIILSLEFKF